MVLRKQGGAFTGSTPARPRSPIIASVINTNSASLNVQRNLKANSAALSVRVERLSSGLRINSAKDDAAGLSISERFSAQIRGVNVAKRNAGDAISLAQVAEGTLDEVNNNLQRIRELAVQAANGTNSSSDRQALNAEARQLVAEIDRVAKGTDFNGKKLLDGSFTDERFQVGANDDEVIVIDEIIDAKAEALGGVEFGGVEFREVARGRYSAWNSPGYRSSERTINGIPISVDHAANTSSFEHASEAANAINAISDDTGVRASVEAAGGNNHWLILSSDRPMELGKTARGGAGEYAFALRFGTYNPTGPSIHTPDVKYVQDLNLSTVEGARQALHITDKALSEINDARGKLGALQNRFDSAIANVQNSSYNLSAARSRILDADYAKETAELARNQIVAQASTALLSQANQTPQEVLSLLREAQAPR